MSTSQKGIRGVMASLFIYGGYYVFPSILSYYHDDIYRWFKDHEIEDDLLYI